MFCFPTAIIKYLNILPTFLQLYVQTGAISESFTNLQKK